MLLCGLGMEAEDGARGARSRGAARSSGGALRAPGRSPRSSPVLLGRVESHQLWNPNKRARYRGERDYY